MKIIVLRGCPASGKTTWAKQFVKDNPNYIRINKDDIRSMFSQKWSEKLEIQVRDLHEVAIVQALQKGYNVILDNTNLEVNMVNQLKYELHEYGFKFSENALNPIFIEVKDFFDVSLETLIERDNNRENNVGEEVIRTMWLKQLLLYII